MSPAPHVSACTIASNNYLAMARVLAESYREHHPGAEVFVCVVDRRSPDIDYEAMPFTTIFAEELPVPAFFNFAFRYSILELNTAVKPYLLSHLRDRFGLDRVFYFDPDILILNPLPELEAMLEGSTLVLTPHITEPLDNVQTPPERLILMSGVYNLGFLGISFDQRTAGFLEWWQQRLYRHCVHDIQNGLFVDQSWMDLAPAFLPDVEITRSPAYNVAYWNLPHRFPTQRASRWMVGEERLGFFHFSGIVFDRLETVSKYQTRLGLHSRPELRPLFERYRDLVMAAGHQDLFRQKYGFARFTATETEIPLVIRRCLDRVDPNGHRWPDPFDPAGADSFLQWLSDPLPFASGTITRGALALWEERGDLIKHFPDVCGADLPAYVQWILESSEAARSGLGEVFIANVRRRAIKGSRPMPPLLPFEPGGSGRPAGVERVEVSQPGTATAWLNDRVGTRRKTPILTRLALHIHASRTDLQAFYADPLGRDQEAFATWFVTTGAREYHLHPDLVKPVLRSFPQAERRRLSNLRDDAPAETTFPAPADISPPASLGPHPSQPELRAYAEIESSDPGGPFGVNLGGYFRLENGVGQIGRATLRVLQELEIPHVEVPFDADVAGISSLGRVRQPAGLPYPVTLFQANADAMPFVSSLLPVSALAGTRRIGYWFWELSHFPLTFADRFDYVDEVWAPTRFCQRSFEAIASVPVRYVPPCVIPPRDEQISRQELGLDDETFYFLFCFDTMSIPERKNPLGLLNAFLRMHTQVSRKIGLVLKINNASENGGVAETLRSQAGDAPVVIHTDRLGRGSIDAFIRACDAYVSLHRTEGLGLPPIEAMFAGKPVIATVYGGVTDFLDETTGFPVRFDLVRLNRDYPPYPAGAVWADPDIDDAAEAMLRVIENPEEAAKRARAGMDRVEGLYSLSNAAPRFEAELRRASGREQYRAVGPTGDRPFVEVLQ